MTRQYLFALSQVRNEATIAIIDADNEDQAKALFEQWQIDGEGDHVHCPGWETAKTVLSIDEIVDITPDEP